MDLEWPILIANAYAGDLSQLAEKIKKNGVPERYGEDIAKILLNRGEGFKQIRVGETSEKYFKDFEKAVPAFNELIESINKNNLANDIDLINELNKVLKKFIDYGYIKPFQAGKMPQLKTLGFRRFMAKKFYKNNIEDAKTYHNRYIHKKKRYKV